VAVDFRKYTADEAAKQLALLEIHLRQFRDDDARFCLERYTIDELAKQLVLLEIHLRQFRADDAIFCMECCFKHLLAIEGLSDECVALFVKLVEQWKQVISWASAIRASAQSGKTILTEAQQWEHEARAKRVWLQANPPEFDGDGTMTTHMGCCTKHLLALEGLADEGITFFPENKQWWSSLGVWARHVRDKSAANGVTEELTRQWGDQARKHRKNIQSAHMGAGGRCECVTGLEWCCVRKESLS
jgi:hypothetical protein